MIKRAGRGDNRPLYPEGTLPCWADKDNARTDQVVGGSLTDCEFYFKVGGSLTDRFSEVGQPKRTCRSHTHYCEINRLDVCLTDLSSFEMFTKL